MPFFWLIDGIVAERLFRAITLETATASPRGAVERATECVQRKYRSAEHYANHHKLLDHVASLG